MRIIECDARIRIAHTSQHTKVHGDQVKRLDTKLDTKDVAKMVAKTLGKSFDNIEIVNVFVSRDVDRDGDEILRIEIVFKGDLKASDAQNVASATRKLRPALDEIDPDLYPLLSFVSKVDYDRGHKSEVR